MPSVPLSLLTRTVPSRPLPVDSPLTRPLAANPSLAGESTLTDEISESLDTHSRLLASLATDSPLQQAGMILQSTLSGLSPQAAALASPVLLDFVAQVTGNPISDQTPVTLKPLIEYVGLLDVPSQMLLSDSLNQMFQGVQTRATENLLSDQIVTRRLLQGYPTLARALASLCEKLFSRPPSQLQTMSDDMRSQGLLSLASFLSQESRRSYTDYSMIVSQIMAAHASLGIADRREAQIQGEMSSILLQIGTVESAVQAYKAGPVDVSSLESQIYRQFQGAIKTQVSQFLSKRKSSRAKTTNTTMAGSASDPTGASSPSLVPISVTGAGAILAQTA